VIADCMIENNTAQKDGGGIYCWAGTDVVVTSCTITGNIASLNGGGISFQSCTPTVTGCDISGNTSTGVGGGIHSWKSGVAIDSTAICSNNPDQIFGPWTDNGDNCISIDCDGDGDGTADCIDGCPDDPNKTEPGDCGCGVADEDANNNGVSDCLETICPGDIDDTGFVDIEDLLILLSEFGPCPDGCEADFDADEDVDVNDLLVLIGGWGPCP